jgi:SAM-dependent methyltransferase
MTEEQRNLQQIVDSALATRRAPVILEAGCGSLSHLRFPPESHIVGIDIDEGQLQRNKGLHERIHGDLQTYPLPERRFDAIVCWNVLEHLERPEDALDRFSHAVREGGIIVLSAPNPYSSKGIITRLTPYAFHVWFYRNIRGWKEAGMHGNPPFPTHLKSTMSPRAIGEFAVRDGLEILYRSLAGQGDSVAVIGRKNKAIDIVMAFVNGFFTAISLGRIRPTGTQYYFVLRKPPAGGN